MLNGKSLAILTAAMLTGCAVMTDPVPAQYGDQAQYDQQQQQYAQQRQQYEQQREQYNRDQTQYRGPPPQFDRREAYEHAYGPDRDPYYRDCQQQRATNQTGGLIIGAIAGGLLGSTIARGPSRGAGTVLGAIAGGAVGAGIGGSLNCEDRGYVNRTYYSGFESGRTNADYRWRNDRTGNYGTLRVSDYYQDRDGFRCARYTQTIWIDGRPVPANGHACRQYDGNWAIVD